MSAQSNTWFSIFRHQSLTHPFITLGLIVSVAAVIVLVLTAFTGDHQLYSEYALIGGTAGFTTTALGTLPALVLKNINQKISDSMLGFSAGMMLAATAFSLLLPGIEAGSAFSGNAFVGSLIVVFGMALGVALMLGLDYFTPHAHQSGGPCGPGHDRCGRAWLFVFAIALHNFPEGMAIGVSFAQGDMSIGFPLTTAIALQDIPEGLAVALTLRAVGLGQYKSVLIAIATGICEPVGSLLGVTLAGGYLLAYPVGLGLAGGAMLFVVSHEVIPDTHRNGHQTLATMGLMVGFALMMMLDTTFG